MHFFKNHHQVREEEHDFSKGSVAGIILRLALPLIVAQFINVLYNIVDRIYIGRIPGASTMALTGVGVCFPLITLLSAFSDLFGTGGAPLCSIARGRKDNKRAGEIMGTVPDLICMVDTETFVPVTTEALKYGKRVLVVGLKCYEMWRTEAGLELVCPR